MALKHLQNRCLLFNWVFPGKVLELSNLPMGSLESRIVYARIDIGIVIIDKIRN